MADAKRIVVISDTQLPYEDRKAVAALLQFIGEWEPDEVVHIGDLMDYPQPSRWSKGTAAEYSGSVKEDSEHAKRTLLGPLRDRYDGPIKVLEGNHDERPRVYLSRYAPALAESADSFHFSQLLDFDSFGIEVLPDFYEFAKNWVMTHGHRGGIRISPIAGNTALNAAKRMGVSVIMGHTHRLAIASHSVGYDGRIRQQLTGFEVGNLMDMRQAGYLRGGTGNWQQGFGLAHVDTDGNVRPEAIPIIGSGRRRSFSVEGISYVL